MCRGGASAKPRGGAKSCNVSVWCVSAWWLIVILQTVHGDPSVKPTARKVCGGGGSKGKDRKTSRAWVEYDAEDRDEQ